MSEPRPQGQRSGAGRGAGSGPGSCSPVDRLVQGSSEPPRLDRVGEDPHTSAQNHSGLSNPASAGAKLGPVKTICRDPQGETAGPPPLWAEEVEGAGKLGDEGVLPTCGPRPEGQREPAAWRSHPAPHGDGEAPPVCEARQRLCCSFPFPSRNGWTAARVSGKSQTFLDVAEGSELPLSSRAHFLLYLK